MREDGEAAGILLVAAELQQDSPAGPRLHAPERASHHPPPGILLARAEELRRPRLAQAPDLHPKIAPVPAGAQRDDPDVEGEAQR